MKIFSIDSVQFQAKKPQLRLNKADKAISDTYTKQTLYEHIDKYMKKQMDKKEYLQKFSNGIDEIQARRGGAEFTPVEKKYINDLITTLDLSESLDKISDRYLMENMKKLLENKQQF